MSLAAEGDVDHAVWRVWRFSTADSRWIAKSTLISSRRNSAGLVWRGMGWPKDENLVGGSVVLILGEGKEEEVSLTEYRHQSRDRNNGVFPVKEGGVYRRVGMWRWKVGECLL